MPLFNLLNKNTVVYLDETRGVLDDARNFYDSLGKEIRISNKDKNRFYLRPENIKFHKNQVVSFVSILQKGIVADTKLTLKRPQKIADTTNREEVIASYQDRG